MKASVAPFGILESGKTAARSILLPSVHPHAPIVAHVQECDGAAKFKKTSGLSNDSKLLIRNPALPSAPGYQKWVSIEICSVQFLCVLFIICALRSQLTTQCWAHLHHTNCFSKRKPFLNSKSELGFMFICVAAWI